eukprot:6892635-Alexandrium_andersonii.AAC.1
MRSGSLCRRAAAPTLTFAAAAISKLRVAVVKSICRANLMPSTRRHAAAISGPASVAVASGR